MIFAYICVVLISLWSINLLTCSIRIPLFKALVAKLCRDKWNESGNGNFNILPTYNKFNNQLYFFSTKGFSILKNSDCTFIKKLYLSPKLTCKTQNTRSYCIDLLVTKFEFISEKEMIFLTKNDGIGYYNGENIKYFK